MIIDDDPLIRGGLAVALGNDFNVYQAESRAAAIDLLRKLPAPPQLALVDLGLAPTPHRPDEGFHLIAELLAHSPKISIFVLSGQNDQSNARHARALGAIDFIAKPCSPEKIKKYLDDALAVQSCNYHNEYQEQQSLGIIGQSPAIQALRSQIATYAAMPFPVLIEGESGCGKSTLLKVLIGLKEPEKGEVFYCAEHASIPLRKETFQGKVLISPCSKCLDRAEWTGWGKGFAKGKREERKEGKPWKP